MVELLPDKLLLPEELTCDEFVVLLFSTIVDALFVIERPLSEEVVLLPLETEEEEDLLVVFLSCSEPLFKAELFAVRETDLEVPAL